MSETSEREQRYVWYRLAGKSEQAIRRAIEASKAGEQISEVEKNELAQTLGLKSPVAQYGRDTQGGLYGLAVFPDTFGHPMGLKDEFYMACPIGRTKAEEKTHFKPQDGIPLTEQEVDELERMLFPAWGGSVPIVSRDPIPLGPPPPPKPPAPSGP